VSRVANQDLARGGRLLKPLGDDDYLAGDEVLVGRGVAGDYLARVDAGAHREPGTVLALEPLVARSQFPAHLDRRPNSPEGVVLVRARDPEHRHDCVADELLNSAAVAFDHGPRPVEVGRLDASKGLGIEPFAAPGRTHPVTEQDADDLARFPRRCQPGAACQTEPGFGRHVRIAGRTCGHALSLGLSGKKWSWKLGGSRGSLQHAFVVFARSTRRTRSALFDGLRGYADGVARRDDRSEE